MQWGFAWPLLLFIALNTDAELYLLKHNGYLYCATDDVDTPALAWNHNLDMENEPLESVYWSLLAPYSAIDCKPEFGTQQCGEWNTTGWRTVYSEERDLPPVFDFRWNDLNHFVINRGNTTHNHFLFEPKATLLFLTFSLLVRDNAIIVLRCQGDWFWRIVIDCWINSDPGMRVEWWWWKSKTAFKRYSCDADSNCKGLFLHNGTRWTTFTLKYEAQRKGDTLKLLNHETGIEHTWTTNETLISVNYMDFFIHANSNGCFGHWRFHLYNILEPSSSKNEPLTLTFVVKEGKDHCISVTYIAPQIYFQNEGAYVQISNYSKEVKKELLSTGNEWKTVKHIFAGISGTAFEFTIFPPKTNVQGFTIGELRACSVGELRVSKMKSDAANECTELKQNKVLSLKPVIESNQGHDFPRVISTQNYSLLFTGIIPNIQDYRNVIVCTSTACTCAPGFQGPNCESDCPADKYGYICSERCSASCKNQKCNHVTGECTDGCDDGWQGMNCLECRKLYFGGNCLQQCSTNCGGDGTCSRDTGHCIYGCTDNWIGERCDRCILGMFGANCNEECSENCMYQKSCDIRTGACVYGCKPGWKTLQCNEAEKLLNDKSNTGKNSGNGSGGMAWLLLIPLVLIICVMLYCRREAIRKKSREFMLRVFPSQGTSANEAPPLRMLRLMRFRADQPISTVQVSPAQLDIPPPIQPRISIPPPAQLDIPPPLLPRRSLLPPAPALEKPSVLVPLFDLAQYIENAVSSGQLVAQHALFPRGLVAPSLEAERPEHAGKNRWRNVLPYDASRVVLDPLPRKPHSHYINASYIDGYMKEKAFIATQGPREETIGEFWRLVWQKNISCIIMLCNLTEAQTIKCAQYWPAVNLSSQHKDELLVRTDKEEAFLEYTVRIFTVIRGDASSTVMQLHYTAWPDHGVPRYAHSLASVLRPVPLDGRAPILVHCSAGVGRTGTVILALAGYAMAQAEGVVDMLALLAKMRSQRHNMVDNATQYETAHRVLLELNTLPGCELPIKNFHAAFRSLQKLGILQTQFWDLSDACRRDTLKSNDLYWPKDKNRFPDIVPSTEGRVLLECAGCSYINAVYVDGLRSRDRYVVTQLPLTNTLGDFWSMVWQREANMVVVLNVPEPTFYLNHVPLWIEGGELQLTESMKVRHVGTVENSIFDTHHVVLRQQYPKRSSESREVSVLSVNHWRAGELTPHHPDALVKLWSEMEESPGTIVLACHDGATASGLMVSAALMLEHLHATGIVDVASAVRRARRTRPQFITSLTQYEFLHTVALVEIENMDVYVNV